jgi:quinol monooxygenase YgiN
MGIERMSDEVSWHVELAIKLGKLDDLRVLTDEMVAATRLEPGTLAYQRFVTEDGGFLHIYERYADPQAALAHLVNFTARFGERYSALVERRRFVFFGVPSTELRRFLDRFGAIYAEPFGGFTN